MAPQMFRHERISLPEIKAKTTNGVRLYETPEGNKYPSITTVLSVRNKQGLFEWRKRVGEDVANHIVRAAAARGAAANSAPPLARAASAVRLQWGARGTARTCAVR